ncbi:MAG: diguanylate cyclase domain-containing protein [Gaiellales bacterium]
MAIDASQRVPAVRGRWTAQAPAWAARGPSAAVVLVLAVALASDARWIAAFAALPISVAGAALLWRAQAQRRRRPDPAEPLLARALSCMSSAISLIDVRDPSGPVVYVNPAFERLTGYDAGQAVGRPWTIGEGPETDPATAARVRHAVGRGQEVRVRIRLHRQDQEAYWSETFLSPVIDGAGAITHYLAVQKDVTAQTEAERRASYLAYHDPLTGLPNRTQIQEQLVVAVARAARQKARVAVLFLDLDGFKGANDRHGHDAGDQLLQEVTRRWLAIARGGDVLARYGGDEFILLMPDADLAQAHVAAERYVAAAREPFRVPARPGVAISLSVSVGVALYPDDGRSVADLVIAADAAMYQAKRGGGSAAAAAAALGA